MAAMMVRIVGWFSALRRFIIMSTIPDSEQLVELSNRNFIRRRRSGKRSSRKGAELAKNPR